MLARWWRSYANIALTGGNLGFLLLAVKFPTPGGVSLAAGLVCLSSLYAWYLNLDRYSAVMDTPTSRIASAPQGYIEVFGKGFHPQGSRLVSPLSGLPCLWYHYIVEQKNGNKWQRVSEGISTDPFGLDDGSGTALIVPDEAEILTSRKEVSRRGHYRHTEWTLIEGETLYVLGEHVTIGGASAVLDFRRDVSDLLAEWKRDQPALLLRFDHGRSGDISPEEWEAVRASAQALVSREHHEARLQPGMHLLRKPAGRLFLIANRTPEHLTSRYRWWAWVHLAFVIMACLTIAALL